MKRKLRTSATVVALIASQDEAPQAPEWVLLFKAGRNELEGLKPYLVDEESFRLVSAEFARRGNDMVFDYEHQTLKGVQAPAAGWIKELSWDSSRGILAKVDWTEAGAAYVASREYRYFSPVFYVRESDGRLVGMHSVALTNNPRHNHLDPILSKLQPMEGSMDFLKKLAVALGLPETATEEEVMAAVAKLREASANVPEVVASALGLAARDASTVVASIHALRQQSKGMVSAEDFEALKAQLAKRDAEEVVASALAAGKITPDQKEWAAQYAESDLPGFKTFVAKAPVVIPTAKLPGAQEAEDKTAASAVTTQIASMMGLTNEDLKTYGGLN